MSTQIIPSAPNARDRILSIAGPLFYREGYRAVGIDRVIAEADVAKATFYRHFPSKDYLIVAWLNRAENSMADQFPAADTPKALSDYVAATLAIARGDTCMGCTFQGSAAEFGNSMHPVHLAARSVKDRLLNDLVTRAKSEQLNFPEDVAAEIFLIIEGLWASTRMFGRDAPFNAAERAFARIITAAR